MPSIRQALSSPSAKRWLLANPSPLAASSLASHHCTSQNPASCLMSLVLIRKPPTCFPTNTFVSACCASCIQAQSRTISAFSSCLPFVQVTSPFAQRSRRVKHSNSRGFCTFQPSSAQDASAEDTTADSPSAFDKAQAVDDNNDDALESHKDRTRKSTPNGASPGRTRGRRPVLTRPPDLLAIPGVGPRNLEKLVAKGIGKIEELKQVYRDKFLDDGSAKMVEYLQTAVGILHKSHAESITAFVKECVDKELKAEDDQQKQKPGGYKKRLTFCVEGNISVGKTTFLNKIACETVELRDLVEIVPEPVGKWKDIGPGHYNLLDVFYAEPQRYAYTFQNYVFVTRMLQEQESAEGLKPLRLMERSIFSDRMVFVRAVHEAKWMNELELSIYDSWFDPFISTLPGLVPDAFIYLRASPDTCHRRLKMRNRPEEQGVTLEYLRNLHEKHEQWLFPTENSSGGVLSVSQWPLEQHEPPPSKIRDRVFYLEGDHLHSCIRKIPALVLDCEAMIDFNKDIEAKAEYAQQIADFVGYVERTKELETSHNQSDSKVFSNLLLPQAQSILRPDSSIFQSHDFSSINSRQYSGFLNK